MTLCAEFYQISIIDPWCGYRKSSNKGASPCKGASHFNLKNRILGSFWTPGNLNS